MPYVERVNEVVLFYENCIWESGFKKTIAPFTLPYSPPPIAYTLNVASKIQKKGAEAMFLKSIKIPTDKTN